MEAQLAHLPDYLSAHLLLTIGALAAGVAISLPLAVLVLRVRPLAAPVLATAGVIQTIPGLALLALMVPLLGRIGVVPALLALTLYSVLPVLRNTVTGALEVDRNVLEAARGIGMTATQTLFRVQLPLALPTIVAGLRTAAVWTVGTATLSTPVGATSLGNYIFSGLQTQNMAAVLVGCAAAAALAISLDGLIRLGLGSWPRIQPLLHPDSRPRVIVGAKTFTEQYILARLISDRLEARGFAVELRDGLGSTVVFDALVAGEIDLYVDYTGTLWANHMGRGDSESAAAVLDEAERWLDAEHGALLLGPLGFENAYALAMRREQARELGVETLEEVAALSPGLAIGGDYEFFARPEWEALRESYGFDFARQRSFDASLMYGAVADGHVDLISAFSSDGRIAAFDLVVLEDPLQALPPLAALRPLIDAIDDADMRMANKLVDVDHRSIQEAADYLASSIAR
ncbi:MAG: ABC transporter permease/substrate-binding protein [Deltaproteobacteria bacterium]|nr:ABC transporter permease/substrate-binding protein [Deltaproteobacteria bacterium]